MNPIISDIIRPWILCQLIKSLHSDGIIIPRKLEHDFAKEVKKIHLSLEIKKELTDTCMIVIMHHFIREQKKSRGKTK